MAAAKSFSEHISARVRGMKSTLLDTAQLDAMIDKSDAAAMADTLLTSPYEVEMAESLTQYAGADAVEDAASRNLVNTFAKLRAACRGNFQEPARLFIGRWDLVAVKSLLRNVHHGITGDAGNESLLPGPSLPVAVQEDLASRNTMDALVQGLAAWNPKLCSCLLPALSDYQKDNDLRSLEEILDRNYFSGSVRKLGSKRDSNSAFLKSLLRMEIDRINLRNVLSPRTEGQGTDEVTSRLLPCGVIPMSLLTEMTSAATPEQALELLDRTPYASLLEEGIEMIRAGRLSAFDRRFELELLHRLRRAAQQQGLGLAVLMHFAWLKYNEVLNLRTIARATDIHLSPEHIREEVVYV
jgi:vacuolar-type H+-ATPase subunit C/Vma6